MYNRKGVGPRVELWETLAITAYSCEDFPSRITQSRLLLLRKKNIRPNIWPEIAYDLSFMERKKTSMSNPVKNLGYTNCYSLSSPRTVKKRKNFIRYNCKKICSWFKDLKPYCKSEKRPRFSRWSTTLLFTSFSKTLHVLQVIQRRLTGDVLKTSASM